MTKKELKEFIHGCLLEIGKTPITRTFQIGPGGPPGEDAPGAGEYPNYDWNKNPLGLDKNDLSNPKVLRRLPPKSQWIRNHATEPLRPPNYPGETAGGTSIRMRPDVSRSMNDYEIEKRRIAIKNQNAHREKVAKEKEDSIKYYAQLKRQRKKEDQIVNMLIWGSILLGVLAVVVENDSSENNNLESGKEVKVKTPISRIEKNVNTPVEKTFLDKVKSKIPQYFTNIILI